MSKKACWLGCFLAVCCPMWAQALSIEAYQPLDHHQNAFHGRLWLSAHAPLAHPVQVWVVSGGQRLPIQSRQMMMNHRLVIDVQGKALKEPVQFVMHYQENGHSYTLHYKPHEHAAPVSKSGLPVSTPVTHHHAVQDQTPGQDVASWHRGARFYLTHELSIYDLAHQFAIDRISDTRMAAYFHIFNPHSVFARVGVLASAQYFYVPTIQEIMGLDQTLWQSYRRVVLENIQSSSSVVHSSSAAIAVVHDKPHPVQPAQKPDHVSVERAVLSNHGGHAAAVEDRVADQKTKETVQQDISVLDTKISALMKEVAQRESHLQQQTSVSKEAVATSPAIATPAMKTPTEMVPATPPLLAHPVVPAVVAQVPVTTAPAVVTAPTVVKVPASATAPVPAQQAVDVVSDEEEQKSFAQKWWIEATVVFLCLLFYTIYRVLVSRQDRIETEKKDPAHLSEDMRAQMKTRVQKESHQRVQAEASGTQSEGDRSPVDLATEEPAFSLAVSKEDLLLQKTESVADILKAAEKYLSQSEDATAERLLIDSITKMPSETALYLKLLHIYFKNGLEKPAEQVIDTVYSLTKGQGSDWKSLLHMSKRFKVQYADTIVQKESSPEEVS